MTMSFLIKLPSATVCRGMGLNPACERRFDFLPGNGFSSSSCRLRLQATRPPAGSCPVTSSRLSPSSPSPPQMLSSFHRCRGAERSTRELLCASPPTCRATCTALRVCGGNTADKGKNILCCHLIFPDLSSIPLDLK